ncbi:MAG: hypothetical protein WCJ37_09605 [Syntrophus sp. (in: bacteria)]
MDATKTAGALGIGRPTVESHLRALEITHAATILRPFLRRRTQGNRQNAQSVRL